MRTNAYKCSIQKKLQIQLVLRDRMNSICPMNFFRTTDTTDTTIWKPGLKSTSDRGIKRARQAKALRSLRNDDANGNDSVTNQTHD